ncbi:MAG: VWA domain-containing protein, partial [Rickettsiales bacterium]|nr:VWA domain-containing protein [Rickettsiales bacterium]
MIRFLFTLCFLIAVSIAPPQLEAKSPPPGNGSGVPANILIMVDTSASMGWLTGGNNVSNPEDLAFDSDGNVYIGILLDYVLKFDSSGNLITSWGGWNGTNADGWFDYINGIDIYSNNDVYVSDYLHNRIQKFDSSGNFITKMNLTSGPSRGVELDSNNNVYALNGAGTIEKFNSSGVKLQDWSNTGGQHVAIDSNNIVYIANTNAGQVEVYNSNGGFLYSFAVGYNPYGIHVDNNDNLVVTNYGGSAVHRYELNGTLIESWTTGFNGPRGVSTDASNTIYVADYFSNRILSPSGDSLLPAPETGLEQATRVIKLLVSDSSLTTGADFGLMEWNSTASMLVDISETGATEIFNTIDSLTAGGGTNLDNAMNLAQSYFLGSNSPMDTSLQCEKNILIVISDGVWTDSTASGTAESLYNNYGIETFVVGFQTSGNANY